MIYSITTADGEQFIARASPGRIHYLAQQQAGTTGKFHPPKGNRLVGKPVLASYEIQELGREKYLRQHKAGRKILKRMERGE